MHLSADDFSDTYAGQNVKTKFDSQNLAVTNVGTRVKVPFEVGAAKFKAVADVNWTQFMGDTRGKSTLKIGSGVGAKIQSDKLSSVAAVGLALKLNWRKEHLWEFPITVPMAARSNPTALAPHSNLLSKESFILEEGALV